MKNALIGILFLLVFVLSVQMANLQVRVDAIETRLFGIYAVVDCMIESMDDIMICAEEKIGG